MKDGTSGLESDREGIRNRYSPDRYSPSLQSMRNKCKFVFVGVQVLHDAVYHIAVFE